MSIVKNRTLVGQVLSSKKIFVFVLVTISLVSILFLSHKNAYAAGPPVVQANAVLTKVADGSAPFSPVDNSSNNGLVATLDTAAYTFDVSFNTLDAQPHSVQNVTITATLSSTSNEVRWMISTLPTACTTKSVSLDGKTLFCGVSGTYATGTTLNISAGWFAEAGVPHETDVTASFSVSANMVPDSSDADDPAVATSNSDTLEVVSQDSAFEVRKYGANHLASIVRDSEGNPEYIQVDWGVQVELQSPTPGILKGVSSSNLGTLTLSDLMQNGDPSQSALQSKGIFIGCLDVNTTIDPYYLASSRYSAINPGQTVDDSGVWSCSQPGGQGGEIDIEVQNVDWSPARFPSGKSSSSPDYWSYNNANIANEIYNNPNGQNDMAVVATQVVRVHYPYSDVLAFDQTAGDLDNRANNIRWCNEIGEIGVDGSTHDDDVSNNEACIFFSNTTGTTPLSKQFIRYESGTSPYGPEYDLGLSQGVLGFGSSDNYIAPGMKFGIQLQITNSQSSVLGYESMTACDAIENNKYTFIEHGATTINQSPIQSGSYDYYSWASWGTVASGFPEILNEDIEVMYSSTGSTFNSSNEMRTINCSDPSLTWVEDPTTLPDGIDSANLVRVRILNDKKIPPGMNIAFRFSVEGNSALEEGDRLFNFSQYQTPTLSSGAWRQAGANCIPENDQWSATSGTYSCSALADRAFVIVASPLTQISDQPGVPSQDSMSTVALGDTRTFTLRSGTAFNADVSISGVKVYTVLPPGVDFISSAIPPTEIISDCKAYENYNCVSDPDQRDNIGYRTLIWDRGDFDFIYNNGDGTVEPQRTLFGEWTFQARVASFVPNAAQLQLIAWTDADSGLHELSYPLIARTTNTQNNDLISGPLDDDWLSIATAQAFAIEKYVSESQIPINGTARFTLAFGNLTGSTKTMDAIDVLPFNDDARTPSSVIEGGFRLSEIIDVDSLLSEVYITSDDPSTINSDVNDPSNPVAGTGKWSCTYSEAGSAGCPTIEEITAIRLVSISMTAGDYGLVQLRLETFGNNGEEIYTNRYQARATGLALPVQSSDVTVSTPQCINIGNLLFLDANKNGKFDVDEEGFEDIDIYLMSLGDDGIEYTEDDERIATTSTDANGRWYFSCVVPGENYIEVAPDAFQDGSSLSGFLVAPDGVGNIGNNDDETDDHNLLFIDGRYVSGVFTSDYNGPNDGGLSNFTIDLGLVSAPVFPSDPDDPNEPNSSVSGASGQLPITGVEKAIYSSAMILIFIGLVLLRKKRKSIV